MNELQKEITWLPSRKEVPTIQYRGVLLHSSGDPIEEAEKVVGPLAGSKPPHCLVFGLGLAYHVGMLRKRLPETEILVFEPAEEIHGAAVQVNYENWPADPKIRVFGRLEDLED
jgi:hypothetical protein